MDLEQANTELVPEKSKIFLGTPELDLPPEYCRYRDEGCDLASSCLNCPFPKCIYDQPRGRQRWLKRLRDREIVRLFNTEGKGVKELASMFGLSQRTVQRALMDSLSTLSPVSPSPSKGKYYKRGADAPLKHPVEQDAFFKGEGEDSPSATPSSPPSLYKGEELERIANE